MTTATGPSAQSDRVRLLPVAPPRSQASGSGEIDLGQLVDALRRRHRLALLTVVGTVLVGGLLTSYQRAFRPIFQGGFKLLVSEPISQDRGDGSGTQLESLALPEAASTNLDTLIQVLTSPLLLGSVERQLQMPEGSIESGVSIDVAKSSGSAKTGDGVLAITLQWPNAEEGQKILERLSQEYLAYSLQQRQEKLSQGLAFLDQQAPALQQRVNELQSRLSSFRQANSFVEPTEQAAAIQARREALRLRLQDLQLQQARLQALAGSVRSGRLNNPEFQTSISPGQTSDSGLVTGAAFSRLIADLTQLEKELADAEATYTDSAPQVRELRMRRDQLRPLLQRRQLDAIESSLSVLGSQEQTINLQLGRLSRSFTANPQQIKEYEALQQQLQVARDNLTSYIKARETFRLQVAQRTLPWRVISPPRFGGKPVKPDLQRNLTLSLLLGSLAGVGLALLRDRLDYVFHSPADLKELPLPLLGVIPHLPQSEVNPIAEVLEAMDGGLRFEVRESLSNLFTNFRLLRADKSVRLVGITSSGQAEGKTTTAALLAHTLARLGQRVLLVDADLRRPRLHLSMGMEKGNGFSTLLSDPSLSIASTIRQVEPGLDLLPSGAVPPDASRLLNSDRCAAVLEQIRRLEGYDLVLFDTPPALLLSDPILLAKHLDGVLFVVGIGRVNRDLPEQALQRMRDTGADVLGLLANLAEQPNLGRYGYGYGYGYGHGYGYGYGDQTDVDDQAAEEEPMVKVAISAPVGKADRSPRRRRYTLSPRRMTQRMMDWLDGRR